MTVANRDRRIRGLLADLQERAGFHVRAAGAALLCGGSWGLAAVAAGQSRQNFDAMRKKKPDVAALLQECEELGFTLYELEMQKRALAGASDRGSPRMLELIAKARRADYRDKVQGSIDVIHRAESHGATVIGGWRNDESSDSSVT